MSDSRAKVVALVPPGEQKKPAGGELFQGVACEKPPRPIHLNDAALAHWDFITDELLKTGQLAKLDAGALEILVVSYARMRLAEEQVQAEGEFHTFPSGVTQLSPWAVAYQRHAARYHKMCKEFGLTIRSRQQIETRDPSQGDFDF